MQFPLHSRCSTKVRPLYLSTSSLKDWLQFLKAPTGLFTLHIKKHALKKMHCLSGFNAQPLSLFSQPYLCLFQ